jgi:wobble nucleotide-excising tRNase
MLRKVLRIKNVGRFEDCKWRCGSQFESMTLIYGENGRGKSTFCDILRSCQMNSADFILGRKRLGATGNCEVELRTDTSNLDFNATAWSASLPVLAIFDTTFVHQNIYAGDRIDHDHKKNLYRVVVGEKGVALARKVEELDVAIRETGKDITSKRGLLEAKLPNGTDLKVFTKIAADADIANKIKVKEDELKAAEIAVKKTSEIKTKGVLLEIATPIFPSEFKTLLAEKLPGIAEDAEKKLRAHLAEHTKGATEAWIARGLDFLKEEACPFCGQNVRGTELIAVYRAFFDNAYNAFKQKLAAAQDTLSTRFNDKVAVAAQKTAGDNGALWEFWRQLEIGGGFDLPDISSLAPTVGEIHESATAVLKSKIAAPLEAVAFSEKLNEAFEALTQIQVTVTRYNEVARKFNAQIAEYKGKQSTADVVKIKNELASLRLVELRHAADIVNRFYDYTAANQKKAQLEKDKITAKEELDNYDQTILATHEKRINGLLDMFGAGFRIEEAERSDHGGKPSFSHKIRINDITIEVGNENTPLSAPSFRNTLSAGDRSTLALALFISQLECDSQIKDKIVIFDDPFTSQDRSRRTATQTIICNLTKKVKQVFVLSHDPHFLRSVWDAFKGGNGIKGFQFSRMANGTSVGEWDIERETTGEYAKKHRVLWDYFHNATGTPRTVAQTIRPLLEEYLRLKLPQSFADNEWLGNFIEKIRNAPDTDPMAAAKCILDSVELINEYSKKYHHSSNPAADTEILDESELANYAEKTLKLVGGF